MEITLWPPASKPKVEIVPSRLWRSLFLPTTGFYYVSTDEIFIRGGLPEVAYRQTLKHELAHRRFFLRHLRFRNFFTRLYSFYCKSAPFFLIFGMILLWWNIAMFLFFVPVTLHFWIQVRVEFPAEIAERMATHKKFGGLTTLESIRFIFSQAVTILWLIIFAGAALLGMMGVSIDARLSLTVIGLALFAKWGLDIMQIKAMKKLRILVTKNWEVSK